MTAAAQRRLWFVSTWGTRGDIAPLLAVALACRRLGASIRIIGVRDFEPLMAAHGLDPDREWTALNALDQGDRTMAGLMNSPLGQKWLRRQRPSPGEQLAARKAFHDRARYCERCLDELATRDGVPDAVIGDISSFRTLYDFCRSRPTTHIVSTPMPYQPSRTYNLCNHPRFPQASFLINTLYWRLKRLRMPAAMRHTFDREIYHLLSASPILFPRPPDWPPHMQVTGYCRPPSATASAWTPPAALRDFIKRGPPPVYVGFGSYPFFTGSTGMELMRTLERELHAQDERVVFCTGFSQCDATPSDPDRTFLIDAVPHDWLLPRCRWAVHHGGCGTLHAALQAGIPMIAYPYQTDQFFWSRRAATLGVSPPCRHHIQQISASSLARGAVYLQQSGAFAKAAQLAETMRHEPDGADRQATLITSILEHTAHGGRPGQWQPPKASVLRKQNV